MILVLTHMWLFHSQHILRLHPHVNPLTEISYSWTMAHSMTDLAPLVAAFEQSPPDVQLLHRTSMWITPEFPQAFQPGGVTIPLSLYFELTESVPMAVAMTNLHDEIMQHMRIVNALQLYILSRSPRPWIRDYISDVKMASWIIILTQRRVALGETPDSGALLWINPCLRHTAPARRFLAATLDREQF